MSTNHSWRNKCTNCPSLFSIVYTERHSDVCLLNAHIGLICRQYKTSMITVLLLRIENIRHVLRSTTCSNRHVVLQCTRLITEKKTIVTLNNYCSTIVEIIFIIDNQIEVHYFNSYRKKNMLFVASPPTHDQEVNVELWVVLTEKETCCLSRPPPHMTKKLMWNYG